MTRAKSLSQREYARHRKAAGLPGGAHRAVQVAIASGRLSKSVMRGGKIRSAAAADAEWDATTQVDRIPITGPTAPAASAPAAPSHLQELRARREAAVVELAEIELAEKRGEVVLAKDVESKLVNVFAHCKTKLLAIAARARQRDPSLTGAQLEMVEGLIREALEELAGGPE